mmetsp:Transcript_119312/g.297654  ORF Transcript_119312/g.297654 Transcript_119312/m.297654 type:complete len:206 (-) Transcript_119312:1756-2373(-)
MACRHLPRINSVVVMMARARSRIIWRESLRHSAGIARILRTHCGVLVAVVAVAGAIGRAVRPCGQSQGIQGHRVLSQGRRLSALQVSPVPAPMLPRCRRPFLRTRSKGSARSSRLLWSARRVPWRTPCGIQANWRNASVHLPPNSQIVRLSRKRLMPRYLLPRPPRRKPIAELRRLWRGWRSRQRSKPNWRRCIAERRKRHAPTP